MKIAILGNCQGETLARLLPPAIEAYPGFDCRYLGEMHRLQPGALEFLRSADRILVQVTDTAHDKDVLRELDQAPGRKILYPLLYGNFLYPFAGKAHPLNALSRSPGCQGGHYEEQVSDAQLITLMARHADEPVQDIVRRYLELDYAQLIDLDRLYEMNASKLRRLGKLAGLDLWPRVEQHFRTQPVFWTHLHPAAVLLQPLLRHMLDSLAIGLDGSAIERVCRDAMEEEPLGFVHLPIHPSIVRHFGLRWMHEGTRYRYHAEGSYDQQQYWERYVGFRHDADLPGLLRRLHAGESSDSLLSALSAAADRLPQSGDVQHALSQLHARRGHVRNALDAALQAAALAPERMPFLRHLADISQAVRDSVSVATDFRMGLSHSFARGNLTSARALASGWSQPEDWGVWSDGDQAELHLKLQQRPGCKVDLRFEVAAYVPRDGWDQVVDIEVNGKHHDTWYFVHKDFRAFIVPRWLRNVAVGSRDGSAGIDILFRLRSARSPVSLGIGEDARALGIGLSSLSIVPGRATRRLWEGMRAKFGSQRPARVGKLATQE